MDIDKDFQFLNHSVCDGELKFILIQSNTIMKEIKVSGQKRTDLGKKASKQLRKEGLIPCTSMVRLSRMANQQHSLSPLLCQSCVSWFTHHTSTFVELVIDGERHTAVLKELQFHPVTDALLHVDFYEVNDQKPITIGVPVKLVGLAQGVRDGGRMNMSIRKINVKAPYQADS